MAGGFRVMMQERGFVTENGRIRWQQFWKAHRAFHSGQFADVRLNAVCHDESMLRDAVKGLMSNTGCVHPVLYCLAHWSLTSVARTSTPKVNVASKSRKKFPEAVIRKAFATNPTATSAAKSIGVAVTTFVIQARELGLQVRRKPSRIDSCVIRRVGEMFKSGENIPTIASAIGLSVCSVYRVLKLTGLQQAQVERRSALRIADARHSWGMVALTNKRLSISQLRKQNPALYARTYRADKGLIGAHVSAPPRLAKAGRRLRKQRSLEAQARAAIRSSLFENPARQFIRVSTRQINRRTGLSEFYLGSCEPETLALVNNIVESKDEFVERRIAESSAELAGKNVYCERWKALRRAGLRITPARLKKL
ncbi:TnsD family Tn7-like transposition protein [Paraburkholderia dipogonis]|uniref:TnsD family Tn7-like transposition protein n=1 Tax=Paraburkholderia dipogonis TaxID=1211383 RepID=UPI0038BC6F8D